MFETKIHIGGGTHPSPPNLGKGTYERQQRRLEETFTTKRDSGYTTRLQIKKNMQHNSTSVLPGQDTVDGERYMKTMAQLAMSTILKRSETNLRY
jgi:hypothetical protein